MLKKEAPMITLKKEYLSESDRRAVNEEAVVKALRSKLLYECDIDQNGVLSKKELSLTKGFIFGLSLKTSAIEGYVRTTEDITRLTTNVHGYREINLHDDGFIIRDAKRKIAQSVGLDESICSKALAVLFDSSVFKNPDTKQAFSLYSDEDLSLDKKYKLILDMGHREYSAFLVNNRDLLIEMLHGVDKTDIELYSADTEHSLWSIPKMQEYKKHTKSKANYILEKNVFYGYWALRILM